MARATVQSIADKLGLSKFAVSRALSGKSGVSAETRKLVLDAAHRQGYEPRKALKNAPSNVIKVIVRNPSTANRELWLDVRHGIEVQAMREGYEVEAMFSDDPEEVAGVAEASAAVILLGPNRSEVMEAAHAVGRPVVACCHIVPPLLEIDQVTGTDEESGTLVGDYLLSLGHRDVVYVHGQMGFPGRDARLRGLRQALGPGTRLSEISFSEDYAGSEFVPAMRKIVESGANPTAFFCGSDGVAVTCQSEILRLGMRVPGDISVVGHADYPLATQVSPNLTTIHMPHREIGLHAVSIIRNRLADNGAYPHKLSTRVQLVADLVERASTGPVGKPDWRAVFPATAAVAK